jgi:SPP1 gp7 family putative phage head morphogenesis protein
MPDKNKITKVNNEVLLNELTYLGLYRTLSNILPYTSERIPAQYKRMRMYPMCWLGLNFIKLGLPTVPPVFEGDDDNDEKTITEALFKRFWVKLINEALEQLEFGWKPAEILWEYGKLPYFKVDPDTGEKEKKIYEGLLLRPPKGLDPETVRILTEPLTGNFSGFEQYGVEQKILHTDHKALLFTHMLESGNFYGISALEPAYSYWFDALLNRQWHMRWLERIGVGVLKGLYPVGTTEVGETVKDNQDVILELLTGIIEGRVVSIPSKRDDKGNLLWDIEYLDAEDRTDPFVTRARYIDEAILRAFIIPEKALTQGEVGARASVEAYQDIFVSRKEQLLDAIVTKIDEDLVQPFVKMNFGEDVEVHVASGEFSDTSKDITNKLVETLVSSGKLKVPTQYLIDKTSIPFEEVEEEEPEVPEEEQVDENGVPIDENGEPIPPDQMKEQNGKEAKTPKTNGKKEDAVVDRNNKQDQKGADKGKKEKKEKEEKLSEGRWRAFNKLEQRYNFSSIESFLDSRSTQFQADLREELVTQENRIIDYIKASYSPDAKFVKVVKDIEVRDFTIKRLFKEFLQDIYSNVYSNVKAGVERKTRMASTDTSNQFIQFRINVTADKLTSDYESMIKYQLSSDLGSRLSLNEIVDRLKSAITGFISDTKLQNISETEIGFTLGKAFEDYLRENAKAIALGLLGAGKEVTRVMFSAIMDKVTCPLCERLDGIVVDVDSATRSKYDPPLHYMCRCAWLPVTKDDIDDPDVIGTDLTLGSKGKPITMDEVAALLGDNLKFKLFSEHTHVHKVEQLPVMGFVNQNGIRRFSILK